MDEIFCALAYPTFVVVCLLRGTLSCDDHQLVGVSRCEEYPRGTGW